MAGFLTREASSHGPSSLADSPRLLFSVTAFASRWCGFGIRRYYITEKTNGQILLPLGLKDYHVLHALAARPLVASVVKDVQARVVSHATIGV